MSPMTDPTIAPRIAVVVGDGPLAADLADGLGTRGYRVVPLAVREVSRTVFEEAFARVAAEHHAIHLVVHAHAHPLASRAGDVAELDERDWIDGCETTVDAAYRVAQAVHPHLAASHGHLVFLVPTLGMTGAAGFAPLATAAESIRALAKGLAKTWGRYGITVNAIGYAFSGDAATETHSLVPPALGRAADTEIDIAPVVALFDGDDAHFVTGATLVLDGGIWMAL
jgi:NAD(P)-dependent dehydrogenase (short-subunit alcohol dehydrogenase family)